MVESIIRIFIEEKGRRAITDCDQLKQQGLNAIAPFPTIH
jgi:hypothetical protein